jgi:hypothetical protein
MLIHLSDIDMEKIGEPSNLNRCANGLIKTTKGYKVKKYQACKDW